MTLIILHLQLKMKFFPEYVTKTILLYFLQALQNKVT